MKEVITGEKLNEVMVKGVDLLCNAVSSTLGPTGNNVLINTDEASPFITNDGVTIAAAIESEDKKINTILEIAKEAALKTNEEVGDGTTTTLVLLQTILKEGLKEIAAGKNPIVLKKELHEVSSYIIKELKNYSRKPTKQDLISIASISANDNDIGKLVASVFTKMKSKYAIKLEESPSLETYYEIKKGYSLEIDNVSQLYFQKNSEIVLDDTYILILRGYLDDLEQISYVINEGIERGRNIVILAEDFAETIYKEVLIYYLEYKKNIFLFKIPDYGLRKEATLLDLCAISNAKVKDTSYEEVYWSDLGSISNIIIRKEEVVLLNDNVKISKRIQELKEELIKTTTFYDKEFLETRIAKLSCGIATIYVGDATKTACKEKLMRFEDALCALDIAKNGVIIGEGITLLKLSDLLEVKTTGRKIMQKALQIPFQKIMQNSGEDYKLREQEIKKSNYQKIYNFQTGTYEDINTTTIIDPIEVTIASLKNATSIAAMLLTTNFLVINENLKINSPEF